MATIFRPKRGKKSTAESQNIVLKKGEVFFEVPDSGVGKGIGKIKMGDGTTNYSNLPYFMDISNHTHESFYDLHVTHVLKIDTVHDNADEPLIASNSNYHLHCNGYNNWLTDILDSLAPKTGEAQIKLQGGSVPSTSSYIEMPFISESNAGNKGSGYGFHNPGNAGGALIMYNDGTLNWLTINGPNGKIMLNSNFVLSGTTLYITT